MNLRDLYAAVARRAVQKRKNLDQIDVQCVLSEFFADMSERPQSEVMEIIAKGMKSAEAKAK